MFRTATAVGIAAVMCTATSPAISDPPPTGARATIAAQAQPKQQKAKVHAPRMVKEAGTTVLLRGPIRTNAGQRVRVSVRTSTRHGKKTTKQDVRVVRKGGTVALEVSGRKWIRAKVLYRAKKAPGYAPFQRTMVYRTWQQRSQADPFGTGANAYGVDWKDFLSGLLSSVGEEVGGPILGWAVGFLFALGDSPKPDPLEDVKRQLEQISAQLDAINKRLDEISMQSAFQSCATLTQLGADAIATINTQAKDFRRYADPKNPNRDRKEWVDWADKVLDNRNGSLQRLEFLQIQLVGQSKVGGALKQCADAFRQEWEQKRPALGEDMYYKDLWTYLNYFWQAQIKALNNVVEAYHIRAAEAWMGGGAKPRPLPAPKDLKSICDSTKSRGAGASPSQNCKYAAEAATDVYYAMLDQAKAAGAGYAWNLEATKSISMRAKTSELWVTDLSKYGDREDCEGPLNSLDPEGGCGPTASTSTVIYEDKGLGYGGWKTATTAQWRTLLGPDTEAATAGEAMGNAGFPPNMRKNIIVYTNEWTRFGSDQLKWLSGPSRQRWQDPLTNVDARCFFDTNMPPSGDGRHSWLYCNQDAAFWFLANAFDQSKSGPCSGSFHYRPSAVAAQGTQRRFSGVDLQGQWTFDCNDPSSSVYYNKPWVQQKPGWMSLPLAEEGGEIIPEYKWPVQDISGRKCLTNLNWGTDKTPLQPRNAGGAWTMCGDDFKDWLKTQLPDPPK